MIGYYIENFFVLWMFGLYYVRALFMCMHKNGAGPHFRIWSSYVRILL